MAESSARHIQRHQQNPRSHHKPPQTNGHYVRSPGARRRRILTGHDHGFTLIEILIVVIILGILIGIAIPLFMVQRQKAELTAAQEMMNTLAQEALRGMVSSDSYATVQANVNTQVRGDNEVRYTAGASLNKHDVVATLNPANTDPPTAWAGAVLVRSGVCVFVIADVVNGYENAYVVTPAVPDNQCTPGGAAAPTADVTVSQTANVSLHKVLSDEIISQGGALVPGSAVIASGAGTIQGAPTADSIRFRKPNPPGGGGSGSGTTVITFNFTIAGTTYPAPSP